MYSYLKFGIRRIRRNLTVSGISILGLTMGLTILTILLSYINHERSYDHFHDNVDRIYKVISKFTDNNNRTVSFGISFGTLAEEVLANFDAVEEATRYLGPRTSEIEVKDTRFNNIDIAYTDYSFFKIFDFQEERVLFERPDQVCISRSLAYRLFANKNPIGRSITFKESNYEVSSVVDVPLNTQFQFDMLVPLVSMESYKEMVYQSGLEFHTFMMLDEQADHQQVLQQISEHYNKSLETRWGDLYEGKNYSLPLRQLHLSSSGIYNSLSQVNPTSLVIIASIALFILVLAIINYSNFHVAGAEMRAKEIGIRKVIGASRLELFGQIISESVLTAFIAGILSIVIVQGLSDFNAFSFIDARLFDVSTWGHFQYTIYITILLVTGIVAGLYPAFYLSKSLSTRSALIKPKKAVNSSIMSLVVVQFAVSTTLLISILIINQQLKFMSDKPLGFDQENVIVIKNFNDQEKYAQVKNQLLSNPAIMDVAASQSEPGGGTSGQFFNLQNRPTEDHITVNHIRVLDNYINTFGLKIINGNDFNYSKSADHGFLINEKAHAQLGHPEIGTLAEMGHRKGSIVGIVKDFHYRPLYSKVAPLVLTIEPLYRMVLSIKVASINLPETIGHIEQALQSVDPKYILEYSFLDDAFENHYKKELQTRNIATYSALVAICLSLMGLFALSIFLIHARSKEVAIRKVVGAGIFDLFWVLSSKIFKWIVIGAGLAIPVSWIFMNKWLDTFSYRIDLFDYFVWVGPLALVIMISISLMSILSKLFQAIRTNPIQFLKEE